MARRTVYFFGDGKADGDGSMKVTLGGKGAGLAEMVRLGLPVPAGFTISADTCRHYAEHGDYPAGLEKAVATALRKVERVMKARFGDPGNPLLLSVRSGAAVSMPGMMDTVLNLGLNDQTVEGLAQRSGNQRFAWDCYRRFVQMYGDVVLGLKPESSAERDPFEVILEREKEELGVRFDHEMPVAALQRLVHIYQDEIRRCTGHEFPTDPMEQLWGSIGAVFESWNNPRAVSYRRLHRIPGDLGTAVNVMSMVFGNIGEESGTGVAFTRNPASGSPELYGEYLLNAQGEDVVAGTRTPHPIADLADKMPDCYAQLERIRHILERHYREMQDVEFTIEQGRFWMLQTRTGKRTGLASVRIAVDMVGERLIKAEEAIRRVEAEQLNQLLRPVFDPASRQAALAADRLLARGLPAGPGAASGRISFTAEDAVSRKATGEDVVLVRTETSPDDIEGMNAAVGILTARGGMTSHAALVARQMGKVCIVGCGDLSIDYGSGQLRVGDRVLGAGDEISIDGNTGEVISGSVTTVPSEVLRVLVQKDLDPADAPTYRYYERLLGWADRLRRLKVRANADTGRQCEIAVGFGAEGVGLCRTEHMFFGAGKIEHVQQMILAGTEEDRRSALARLLPIQRTDFAAIFRAMNGRPVTIRLLDPPLHEFLPHTDKDQRDLADTLGVDVARIRTRVEELHEFNPMLGFRGCRLGIVHPEITTMQAQAVFEAVCDVQAEGIEVNPEVMVPLVGHWKEFAEQEVVVRKVAEEVSRLRGSRFAFLVGTMIEVPRAALTADEIAGRAEFFSFGTNDLTQTGLGLSRDDSGRFLEPYVRREIYAVDPFQSLDVGGVGKLIEYAVEHGRSVKRDLKIGICGEHGGDPASIEFCEGVGLDYVSCSPYRIPIARVAAAQAALKRADRAGDATATAGKKKKKPTRKKTATKKPVKKKPTRKKTATKKPVKKKAGRKKAATKKPVKKKAGRKKAAAKKPVKKKAGRKKAAAKKPVKKKAGRKKAAAKKPVRKKAGRKKAAAKKPVRKKAGRKKAAAKKPVRKKVAGRKAAARQAAKKTSASRARTARRKAPRRKAAAR